MITPEEFVKSGAYLPDCMSDFHDAKSLFKLIHSKVKIDPKDQYIGNINWVSGQCYVVDVFLWFMAKRGYTLQRCRKNVSFVDLSSELAEQRNQMVNAVKAMLNQAKENKLQSVELNYEI